MSKDNQQVVELYGQIYITHPALQFGAYDNSSEAERANALYLLREIANLHQGEIAYDYQSDTILNLCASPDPGSQKLQWRMSYILFTGYDPSDDKRTDIFGDLWPSDANVIPPNAIIQCKQHQTNLYILQEQFHRHNCEELLDGWRTLDDEAEEEVSAILQDGNWDTHIRQALEEAICRLARRDYEIRQRINGSLVGITTDSGNTEDEGIYIGEEKHLKAAFWEHLKKRGDQGYFNNTLWEGFDLDEAAPYIINLLLETTTP
jgi:hypothetical protein